MKMKWKVKRAIMVFSMQLSDRRIIGPLCTRIAAGLRGPYKDKRILAHLTDKPYISRRAQIMAADLTIGRHCFIDDYVTIFAHNDGGSISLGQGVHLYRGTNVETGHGGSVSIGDDTHVQGSCNLKGFLGSLRIGKDVQIAPQCVFSPYEHGIDDVDVPIRAQPITTKGDIVVEDDAWLGAGVIVLNGVTIGRGAVIGAGSVVTKDIPPYSVAIGVPACVVRQRGER